MINKVARVSGQTAEKGEDMKTFKKIISLVLAVTLMVSIMPGEAMAYVKKTKLGTPTYVDELCSTTATEYHNYVKVTTSGGTMTVECETPLEGTEFNFSVRSTDEGSKSVWLGRAYPTDNGDYYSFNRSLDLKTFSGDFVLLITIYKPDGAKPVFYKNCMFNVTDGVAHILQYDSILKQNQKADKAANKRKVSKYKSTSLSDFAYMCMKNPKTNKTATVTKAKVKYFKKVADSITKGAGSDYEKARKIYEYVGENFYYDNLAFSKKQYQYVDPYQNLKNLRSNIKSANSVKGDGQAKVATTCIGYAAMVVALCRAEGIPARVANGHHLELSTTYNNWTTENKRGDITSVDHWWAEAYVDGRWIIIDATTANSNKWIRKSFSEDGTWEYTGLTNYINFDPSPEQFAQDHETFEIVGKF